LVIVGVTDMIDKGPEWPEEVLTRMESSASALESMAEAARVAVEPFLDNTVRESIFELRREVAMNTHYEREVMLHLTESVRKLALEVRDLRYAFLLASSRKDRKKGIKALSRLLSG
jgi:hypothetical protein